VSHPFIYLLFHSFLNRTKARLKRLKQPKYLMGGLFFLAYIYVYFFRILFGHGRAAGGPMTDAGALLSGAGAVILLLLVLSAWIFPHRRAALIFSEAEIAFLFPAPIKRRSLIHYKLLKSQLAILFTVLLLTLLTGRFFASSGAWMHALGWWVILSTLNLHLLGASFGRTMLLERGVSNRLRRTGVLLLLAVIVGAAVAFLGWSAHPTPLPEPADWSAWRDYVTSLLRTPPLRYLLAPFYVVLGPYLAVNAVEFWRAFGFALPVIFLHYVWVVQSNVTFEEASLDASRRLADRIAAARQGRTPDSRRQKQTRAPFKLAPLGFAPAAFLWKNLISAKAMFRARTLLLVAIPIVVAGVISSGGSTRGRTMLATASLLTLMLFVWSLLLGAQFVRCDFRQDLNAMDVLKLYPLPGWQVALGEVTAPVVILTAAQLVLLTLLAALGFLSGGSLSFLNLPLSWLLAAGIIAPFWNGLVLLIPNAAVLLFPAWFQTRADAPQGIEVAGQRLMLLFGQFIIVLLSAVPAAVGFAFGYALLHVVGSGTFAPVSGALGGAIVLLGEIALGIWFVGRLFDRFDLAAEQENH
jgi:ABC-2 type transport system permease protein